MYDVSEWGFLVLSVMNKENKKGVLEFNPNYYNSAKEPLFNDKETRRERDKHPSHTLLFTWYQLNQFNIS